MFFYVLCSHCSLWSQGTQAQPLVNYRSQTPLSPVNNARRCFLLPPRSHSNRCWVIHGCQLLKWKEIVLKTGVNPGHTRKVLLFFLTLLGSFITTVFQKKYIYTLICPFLLLWKYNSHTEICLYSSLHQSLLQLVPEPTR